MTGPARGWALWLVGVALVAGCASQSESSVRVEWGSAPVLDGYRCALKGRNGKQFALLGCSGLKPVECRAVDRDGSCWVAVTAHNFTGETIGYGWRGFFRVVLKDASGQVVGEGQFELRKSVPDQGLFQVAGNVPATAPCETVEVEWLRTAPPKLLPSG